MKAWPGPPNCLSPEWHATEQPVSLHFHPSCTDSRWFFLNHVARPLLSSQTFSAYKRQAKLQNLVFNIWLYSPSSLLCTFCNQDNWAVGPQILLTCPTCAFNSIPVSMKESENIRCLVVSDSATAWTAARKAPLSMKFSRQEYWSGMPFLLQGIFPTQGSNPGLLRYRQILYCLSHQKSQNLAASHSSGQMLSVVLSIRPSLFPSSWQQSLHHCSDPAFHP